MQYSAIIIYDNYCYLIFLTRYLVVKLQLSTIVGDYTGVVNGRIGSEKSGFNVLT